VKKLIVAVALGVAASFAGSASAVVGNKPACKLITAAQYKKVVGPVTLKTSEGVSTCLVGKKLVTAVAEIGPLFLPSMRTSPDVVPAAGLKDAFFSKRNGGLYALKGRYLMTLNTAPGYKLARPKMVALMKLAVAKVDKLPLVAVTFRPSTPAQSPSAGAGGSDNLPAAPALPSAGAGGSSTPSAQAPAAPAETPAPPVETPAPPASGGDPTLDPATLDTATP